MGRLIALLVACAALFWAADARAHAMRAAYIEIVEAAPGDASVVVRLPSASREARVVFPPRCVAEEIAPSGEKAALYPQSVRLLHLRCERGLAGEELGVEGFGVTVNEALVRVVLADRSSHQQVLTAAHPSFTIPVRGSVFQVFRRYVELGVTHIWSGIDHLLFILGLLWLARTPRRIVVTATAFTVAHSLTLAATALGWLRVPPLAAEACIAVSLVLVGLDVGRSAGETPVAPMPIAFGFGLVHGLGFAGSLAEIGLPEHAIAPALLAFNVGVEVGQLLFIAACLGVFAVALRLWPKHGNRLRNSAELATAYVVGSAGAYLGAVRASALFGL